jgi:hypothetical protein
MKNQLQHKLSIQKSMVTSFNTLIMRKQMRETDTDQGGTNNTTISSAICLLR